MKTEETNKLIAEFLNELTTNSEGQVKEDLEKLDFHYNWNSLMRAIEKIETIADWSLELLTTDKKQYQMLIHLSNTNIVTENKFETVYNACVEFIKWYNKQNSADKN